MMNKNAGFTLMELVVYIAILLLATLFLFEFLTGILINQSRTKTQEAVINNVSGAINVIDTEIRHAASIYEPTSNFASSTGQLTLRTEKDAPAEEEEIYVDIYIDENSRVCVKKDVSAPVCITTEEVIVTDLQFNKINFANGTESGIQTIMTAEFNTADADNKTPYTVQSFARLRSY